MIFSKSIGLTLFSIYGLFLSIQFDGSENIYQQIVNHKVLTLPLLVFLIIFLYHDLYLLVLKLKKYVTAKYGVSIDSSKRKLNDAGSGSKTGSNTIKIDKRLHVFSNLSFAKEFKSQLIWIPYDLDNKSLHQGAGVLKTPKNIKVNYLSKMPFIYYVDVSFLDKDFLSPRNQFNFVVDGTILLSNILIWIYLGLN